MQRVVNLAQLGQTHFDSATPSGNAIVGHPIHEPGSYLVARARGTEVIRTHRLVVGEPDATHLTPGVQFSGADVTAVARAEKLDMTCREHVELRAGGYASFTGEPGSEETARIDRLRADGAVETVWDSTRLGPGDVYALAIARPGTYRMTNRADRAAADLRVSYPQRARAPYRPAEPVTITCGARGFSELEIVLGPLQGLIVHVEAAARIVVDLVEPDDGPKRPPDGPKRPPDGPKQGDGPSRRPRRRRAARPPATSHRRPPT